MRKCRLLAKQWFNFEKIIVYIIKEVYLPSTGGVATSKLGVSGDSAGGRLAAVVCHEAKDVVDFAVSIFNDLKQRQNAIKSDDLAITYLYGNSSSFVQLYNFVL